MNRLMTYMYYEAVKVNGLIILSDMFSYILAGTKFVVQIQPPADPSISKIMALGTTKGSCMYYIKTRVHSIILMRL